MRPTPEQIEKAGYWFNKNIRARKTVEQLSTAYVLAAYAAHCVAETLAEKDAEIARLRAALQNLNAEIDAFWNADPAAKYHEGRISPYFERAIINGQIECRAALQEKKE